MHSNIPDTDYGSLLLPTDQAETIVREHFGILGKAHHLPGEIDINYGISVNGESRFILKISRPNASEEAIDFQKKILLHLEASPDSSDFPKVIRSLKGELVSNFKDRLGRDRRLRLLSWIPGRLYSSVNPRTDDLRHSLGVAGGRITRALQGFDHPEAHRNLDWDIGKGSWTREHNALFDGRQRSLVSYFQEKFLEGQAAYFRLRRSVIHNDANDNNILVDDVSGKPAVRAIIDFGDAVHTQVINDLAIACAYAIMETTDPLSAALPVVRGYNEAFPLLEEELHHLYTAIAMRLVISVTKSAINKTKEPGNKYLQISERPAWDLLEKWRQVSSDLAHYRFREVCGMTPHPEEDRFRDWARSSSFALKDLFPTVNRNDCVTIDLSVSSTWLGHHEEFSNFDRFQFKLDQLQKEHPKSILAGGYLEPRMVYTTSAYDRLGNSGKESRTIHLGVDFWLPAGTPVHAILDGEVAFAVNDAGDKEYGGLVVLKHREEGLCFYSLYGHLSVQSATKHQPGDQIRKGEAIAVLGNYPENGNWTPHLHFQVMLSLLDYRDDFPGVGYFSQVNTFKSICPDPNLLFGLQGLLPTITVSNVLLSKFRKEHLGKGLSLSYEEPVQAVRGMGAWLIDQYGRKYLDTVNNVAHVGHEHYRVVRAGQQQMALLNTNTRYLHENINQLAAELMETLPPQLEIFHFVNSGSEANELALRMARTATGARGIIASEVGYHGNTNACIEISSYKFNGPGGSGCPEHTHIFPLPDAFRGKYRGAGCGVKYAAEVSLCVEKALSSKGGLAGLIVEPIISCGGQVELPEDFLPLAYDEVRRAGGLCISDEVQVGCGRMGKTFWGFQLYGVTPDIVTIGKPLGNGHPVAAVACTKEVAERFANGMEYFNTFGGNPVSCAIATEVLRTVKREGLQRNALETGNFLKENLKQLAEQFPVIGDVRGQGLFLGIELTDRDKNPLPAQTGYLVNRMRQHGVLMSIDGPDHNVLKIKPPLVFSRENALELLEYLKKILAEDPMNP